MNKIFLHLLLLLLLQRVPSIAMNCNGWLVTCILCESLVLFNNRKHLRCFQAILYIWSHIILPWNGFLLQKIRAAVHYRVYGLGEAHLFFLLSKCPSMFQNLPECRYQNENTHYTLKHTWHARQNMSCMFAQNEMWWWGLSVLARAKLGSWSRHGLRLRLAWAWSIVICIPRRKIWTRNLLTRVSNH
jgi:hypothetical protein